MNVLKLTATQFFKPMSNGRTRPLLLGAETAAGMKREVVVKLRGRELTVQAQICELVAAPLAEALGLDVPVAAIVDVPPGFDAIVPSEHVAAVKASPGLNFGSIHLGAGFTSWAVGRTPHGIQRDHAAAIFAFDLLVQNHDRRSMNPNLWARSDRLGVYDHEAAFSPLYLPIIGGAPLPWVLDDQARLRFMEGHVFYSVLRGGRVDLGPFGEKLAALQDETIEALLSVVPEEWRRGNDLCEKIAGYLREAREQRTVILNLIRHILR
jgi:hypothetical protein